MTADPELAPATQHAAACCLDRWCCEAQPGVVRGDMAIPCGFEMTGMVEGCPKQRRENGQDTR